MKGEIKKIYVAPLDEVVEANKGDFSDLDSLKGVQWDQWIIKPRKVKTKLFNKTLMKWLTRLKKSLKI
jgi:hypothetical protein